MEAPVDANVWKIEITEGQEVVAGQTVAVLEAMKLEINVTLPEGQKRAKVEKLLVSTGVSFCHSLARDYMRFCC